ncbi:MAG TPA: glycoside hydrolase family 88 protein, partial [Candidatus Spyradenecus faecavium]|nr:glycoside hydrolase family 88 protein [Candidatus Spyradenecus faecavium]
MKQLLTMVALFAAAVALAELPTQADIRRNLRRVAEWQVVHQPQSGLGPTAWTNGALYQGMLD